MGSKNKSADEQGARQRERIMDFLLAYHTEHGWMPTRSVIAAAVNLDKHTVGVHLRRMEADGLLVLGSGTAGQIKVLVNDH